MVTCDSLDYARPVRRLAIRWRKKNGKLGYAMIISTLEPKDVVGLLRLPIHIANNPNAAVLTYAALYDQRGGTIEIEIREDKQGIGITKKSKKRFAGQ